MSSRALLRTALLGCLSGLFFVAACPQARGAGFDLGSLGIDPTSLGSPAVVKALVGLIAFGTQHRPYEPATPLGLVLGLDFSLEVTLFKIPDDLFNSLSATGAPAASPLPSLPIAKLHLHKGFGDFVDLGGSIFYLPQTWVVGSDLKIVVLQGEEGPTFAARFCYTYTSLTFNGISMSTHTYSPQFLMSRQMEFADPYLGTALELATGSANATVNVPVDTAGTTVPVALSTPSVWVYGAYAFGGVSLRIPRSGLRVTLEGSYNTAGTSTMGTKIGFTF